MGHWCGNNGNQPAQINSVFPSETPLVVLRIHAIFFIFPQVKNMATIEKRKSGNGEIGYRVKVRLKGFPLVQTLITPNSEASCVVEV